jgi:hypothetical protein
MNKYNVSIGRRYVNGLIVFLIGIFSSCESFLEVDLPENLMSSSVVYEDDATAGSALNGIYHDMLDGLSFSSGSNRSVVALTGLSSDELVSYSFDQDIQAIYGNNVLPKNSWMLGLWKSMYKTIYEANAVMEGISRSTGLTDSTRRQLIGEARFIRAFCYFYLVNLYNDVPLITTTSFLENAKIGKSSAREVYELIINDLSISVENLSDVYVTVNRTRPNRFTAIALLARVHLYLEDWENAEKYASMVIEDSQYQLADVGLVFLKESTETIWQLRPIDPNINTQEGSSFILTFSPVVLGNMAISDQLISAFEENDERRMKWVGTYQQDDNTWYYPFKYKANTGVASLEYSIVFRLAEQYLIRAEARTNQGHLDIALADVDTIRTRAGLERLSEAMPPLDGETLVARILSERRVEFFAEWGHRWLDLKRTRTIDGVLGVSKPSWESVDANYPIPETEISKNPELGK